MTATERTEESRATLAPEAPPAEAPEGETLDGAAGDGQAGESPQSPTDLVKRLKAEGVTFKGVGEERAAELLSGPTYYEQISCYLPLFERRVGGSRDGQFVDLDFSQLLALRRADERIRTALLAVALSAETAMRSRLHSQMLRSAGPDGSPEDGRGIVADYFAGLAGEDLGYRTRELERLGGYDYAGRLYREHKGRMTLGVYLQCAMLGALCDLALFCARRWRDEELRQMHYLLKDVRRLRNSLAHGSPVLCELTRAGAGPLSGRTALMTRLSELGVSRSARKRHADGEQMVQLSSLVCLVSLLEFTGEELGDVEAAFSALREASEELSGKVPPPNPATVRLASVADLTAKALPV